MKKQTKQILGFAALGLAAWYLFGRSSSSSSSAQTAMAAAPRRFGDPADPNSVAHACNVASRLYALGHPREAASWASACQNGGGTVPPDAAHYYT